VCADTVLDPGYVMAPYHDSLLAKTIVQAETGNVALARLRRALDGSRSRGLLQPRLHKRLARLDDVQAARCDAGFLKRLLNA
jgi:biotin carboxylase